ncbi:MAG: GIY-YIG nuclease family protein [Planctomycetaceae bacterium]
MQSATGGFDVDTSDGGKQGFVYILTNPAMNPDFLKIGMTTRTPEQRASEISNGTGVVCAFQVAYEEPVDDCHAIERILHERLARYRMQTNREFFCLPLKDAIRIVRELANPDEDIGGGTRQSVT